MREGMFFLGVLLFPFFVEAQGSKQIIDSLKQILNKGNDDQQFGTLTLLTDEYSNNDLDKAMFYAKKALDKARLLKSETRIALSYNSIANIFQYKTALDSALFFHKKALKIRLTIKDSIGIADTYNNIGIMYDTKGQYPDALKYYFKALYYFDKKENIDKQAMTNSNIGIVYKAQKVYTKGLYYYKKAYELYLKTDNDFGKTTSAGNLGSILINFKEYKESLKYSEIAKQGYKKLGYDRFMGYPVSTIAFVYDSLHQFKLANKNYIEAIELHEKHRNGFEVAETTNAYALCLIKQKKYIESIIQSKKALDFAKKADAYLLEVHGYKNLSKANAAIGKYDLAYLFSNLYSIGKDSLFANEKTKTVFELETKYQTEKKEKLLLQKNAEAKQKNNIIIGVSILAILLALIGFLIYRQQKQKIFQQTQEYKLKKAIVAIENQNKLQEQRLSISRDLHDNIGAQLTFIISSVDNIKYAFDITNNKLDNKLNTISSFAKDTIVELRDTIWAMNSSEISYEDLEVRINNYIEKAKISQENISFSFAIDEELKTQRLTSVQGMNIYRTIQEAVNNALKYANASVITIKAKKLETQTKITIQDNGIGFDQVTIEKGNGLENMQKRIEEIGGEFSLSSGNEGTKISILI
jgi:signal transduction histidine kinase